MPNRPSAEAPEWYVISLRPRGEHAALRRAAARSGGRLVALSPWVLRDQDDEATRTALREALAAQHVVVTSPAAVRAAARLQPLRALPGQAWFAVGAGSAAALRRAGVDTVSAPTRMDSEGLMALQGLQHIDGSTVGLVTAPGGRGALTPALLSRGARVLRADVYERVPLAPPPRAVAALRTLVAPTVLALSSDEALQLVLAGLPDDVVGKLHAATVVAASPRLADLARSHGFVGQILVASGPRPRDLIAAVDPASLKGSERCIR